MEVLAASVIAVLGTLLGAAVTHRYQQRAARFTAKTQHDEKLRQERLDAYAAYGGALMDYRRALMDHWFAKCDGHTTDDITALRRETFQRRTAAQELMFRVELLSDSPELVETGRKALGLVADLYYAETREVLDENRAVSRTAIYDFISASKRHVTVSAPQQ